MSQNLNHYDITLSLSLAVIQLFSYCFLFEFCMYRLAFEEPFQSYDLTQGEKFCTLPNRRPFSARHADPCRPTYAGENNEGTDSQHYACTVSALVFI